VPEKYFHIDGVATFLRHTGPTTLPGAPPAPAEGDTLVCLHGAGGNGHLFAGLEPGLAGEHAVIAFDQPGHGRSGELDSLGDVGRMAGFTLQLLDRLDLEQVVLVGHDMGAAVALQCALERPAAVRALVLCSAGDRFELPDATIDEMQRVRDGKARRPFDRSAFSEKTGPDVMKQAFMEGVKTDPRATFADLVACREWKGGERAGEVTVPALVVVGEDDWPWVQEAAGRLAERMPNAVLEPVPAAGHSLLLEAPGPLAERIRRFLAGLPA